MKKILQTFCACFVTASFAFTGQAYGQSVFINEIHYDNASGDVNEAIEIAGLAGTNLTGWSLVLYNGSNGAAYRTNALTETVANQSNGYGFVVVNYPTDGIQNGAPDAVALVNAAGTVVQFLSYEGVVTATDGPANGMTSTNIGVAESNTTPVNYSLQLTGNGTAYAQFTWATEAASSFGAVNTGQSFGTGGGTTAPDPEPEPDPQPQPQPANVLVFINEIHYDNAGTDAGEGVEVAGLAGTDLTGWQLVPYNGNGGTTYNPLTLSGILPNQQAGFGTMFFSISGLQNGALDGIALVNAADSVIQFLSYEGSFAATNGPANGMTSTDIGVLQESAPTGSSLQLTGSGSAYTDFTWAAAKATYDTVNNNQVFLPLQDIVFINEIHYDNVLEDANEGVEVAGTAGVDLTGWQLIPYNGNGGTTYSSLTLSGIIPNQQNGFGTLFFPIAGLQNGAPDGIALVNAADSVIQFLSYEGAFAATSGPAAGLTSTNIGVEEGSSTPANFSLQLTGSGFNYSDFTWSGPIASTANAINTGQNFGGGTTNPDPEPEPQKVTIAQARNLLLGTRVIISGTLTVADELGGPAFIQDATGGIALFDADVHGEGTFNIGDSLQVTASIGAFNEQVQLVEVTNMQSFGPAINPIMPLTVNISQITNVLEGQLITIPDASFTDTRGLLFPESNYTITDGTNNLQLRIDGDVESLVGREVPDAAVTVTGVLGSFRGTLQILPRFIQDLPGTTEFTPAGTTIPIARTLDVMTWNMEFFGSTLNDFGPTNNALQLQNARKLIDTVHADIIAVQEISDENLLQQLVEMLPGNYQRVCSERYSYSFEGEDPTFPAQKLCFIYNADVISLVDDRVIFEQLYDAARSGASTPLNNYPTGDPASFWSSGRLPYMVTVDATVEGVTERVQLINIHAKSGLGSEDLLRRSYDVQALKDTLNVYYPNANLIILGDYNDDVDESIGGGPSTYRSLTEAENFRAVTATLSAAGLRSFVTQDNVIDHITISDELFDNHLAGSETLIIPFSFIPDYANTTSDHLPAVTRFELKGPLTENCTASGFITREQYNASNALGTPVVSTLTSFEANNKGDYFAARILGYICPPQTGNYTFWISGDDATRLNLSTDANPANAQLIAYSLSRTNFREYNKYASQKSASIYLEAGKKYYIEAQHAEFWAGDHVTVAWQLLNGTFEGPIPGSRLSPYVSDGQGDVVLAASTQALRMQMQGMNQAESLATPKELTVYPNPFSDKTTIEFVPAEAGELQLEVYNTTGELVRTLYKGQVQAGKLQQYVFDGSGLAAGVYVCRVTYQGKTEHKRIMLLK